ncbi:MAG: [acyl-carrier-protein] S-malonyltransferase [Acidobacteria bacterium]|nr:MAG: [acyl-carrier-protein] S-malonyltransferase [Acidobacteriota bacterium]REK02174.1 MAG: [acyl-carrier-protein] S-malonyltransferase [Acidobacteriota bacterium]REK14024.1 MAG: [acyl-carrier-protein] S-malonyltransferase [Acidobacteriota bacterium]REK42019.1 MAG: [acyl-carrier-protein] S-malonyltransferase [Acidobacteriota bacterium]
MGKTAYIFPGQGSQSPGMGKDIFDNYASARTAFAEADEALGFSISEMCFSGTDEQLALTANTQPAILSTSVAVFRAMKEAGFRDPDYVAGHSLGEYSALVAAGAVSLRDAAETVRNRGSYMQEAVPVGVGAMAAIIGLDLQTVESACRESAEGQVCSPANINSPRQIVIAGDSDAVDRACEILKEKGAKRAIRLNVSAPFHCSLMTPAQIRLAEELNKIEFSDPAFPVVENVTAEVNLSGDRIVSALTEQVSSPVRWLQTVEKLIGLGVDTFVEVGPGKVLSGLVRQTDREVQCFNVEDSESLGNTLKTL